ncbi:MAG: hypothetical protein N2Z40_01110 [Caldimicrobium sp.]|nr:hypothetical protein [Caldimicrobium sp.]MCX7612812.1 hypothetical protein [Caldimicrobium sp.]MDW8182916.1 hypothetical protein [Caldimicrobium sp.]
MKLRFLVYLFENEKPYFRGWFIYALPDNPTEGDYQRMREEIIKACEHVIKKHFKGEFLEIKLLGERYETEKVLIYDYYVRGRRVSVLLRHVGFFGYLLSKIFPFFG